MYQECDTGSRAIVFSCVLLLRMLSSLVALINDHYSMIPSQGSPSFGETPFQLFRGETENRNQLLKVLMSSNLQNGRIIGIRHGGI